MAKPLCMLVTSASRHERKIACRCRVVAACGRTLRCGTLPCQSQRATRIVCLVKSTDWRYPAGALAPGWARGKCSSAKCPADTSSKFTSQDMRVQTALAAPHKQNVLSGVTSQGQSACSLHTRAAMEGAQRSVDHALYRDRGPGAAQRQVEQDQSMGRR